MNIMATGTRIAISREACECFGTRKASDEPPYIIQVVVRCAIEGFKYCGSSTSAGRTSSKGGAISIIIKRRVLVGSCYCINMAIKADAVALRIEVYSYCCIKI
jgi:hypothetical protein